MISLLQATELVIAEARPLGVEFVDLERAIGRVLADHVTTRRRSPQSTVSAMDGYAVRDDDLAGDKRRLVIVGEARPGRRFDGRLAPGACVRIFTGAPVPHGADRVIMQEDVLADGVTATVCGRLPARRHVRTAGSDFDLGERILAAGRVLTPTALVAAASADVAQVAVWRRPQIAILSTGDELVAPGTACPGDDRIPDSVSFGIHSLVEAWGGEVIHKARLGDDLAVLQAAAEAALDVADVVVVTGGASVGDHDLAKPMFCPMELLFAKVAMKPGKPVWFARARGKLVVGLPGNPTAAMVTARLLLAPLIAGLAGRSVASSLEWRSRSLTAPLSCGGDREHFLCGHDDEGVAALPSQDSSGQKALAQADLLIRRAAGAPPAAVGELVDVLNF